MSLALTMCSSIVIALQYCLQSLIQEMILADHEVCIPFFAPLPCLLHFLTRQCAVPARLKRWPRVSIERAEFAIIGGAYS